MGAGTQSPRGLLVGGGLALVAAALMVVLAEAAPGAADGAGSAGRSEAEIAQDAPDPLPTGLSASVAPDGVVTLTWDAGPNEGYTISRDGGVIGDAPSDATSFVDDEPPPDGEHTYEVKADGLTAPPSSVTATVATPRQRPQNLLAGSSGDAVTLAWDSPDQPFVGDFRVYRDGRPIATTGTTGYTDVGLNPGTYEYEVTTLHELDPAVESARAGPVQATVEPEPVPPPSPEGLTATASGDTVSLSWDGVVGADSYGVYRDGTRTATTPDPGYEDPGLADGAYTYHVTARRNGLESNPSDSDDALVVTPPPAPQGLAASVAGDTVSLTWDPPDDASDVGGYRVYRDGSPVGRTGQPGFDDPGLEQGTYEYTVTSVHRLDDAVESQPSEPAQAEVLTPPAPPELTASVDGDTVTLTWKSPPDIGGHRIYRDGVQLAERPASARTYVDRGLDPGTHIYRVSVVHRLDPSIEAPSGPARVEIAPPPPPPAPSLTARLDGGDVVLDWTWSPAPGGPPAAGFTLFRDGAAVAIPSGGTRTSRDADPAPGTYTYWLFAHDTNGRTSPRSNRATVLVPAPDTGDGAPDEPPTPVPGTDPGPVTEPGPVIDPTPLTDPQPTGQPSGDGDGQPDGDGPDQPDDGDGDDANGDSADDDADGDGGDAEQPPLEIEGPAVDSGAEVVISGAFCDAGDAVSVAIGGTEVATATADDAGTFRVPVDAPADAGRHDVTVTCDGTTRTSSLDVVVSTSVGGAATSTVGTVLAFFLFIGLVLWPRATR